MRANILMFSIGLASVSLPAFAQSPFFWDDFDRESIFDTKIPYDQEWSSRVEIVDGSAIVTPTSDVLTGLRAFGAPYADVSFQALVRFLDVQSCAINPWIGLVIRDPFDGQSNNFWGGPAADGSSYLGETVNGANTIRETVGGLKCDDLKENDIHIQLDAVGDVISLRAWLDGEPKPEEAQARMADNSNPWGDIFAIIINPDPNLSGFAIRHLAALPVLDGDFDGNGLLELADLDLLVETAANEPGDRVYDLDTSGELDTDDLAAWLQLYAESSETAYRFGDANLDGRVDSQDLNVLGVNWNQETNAWSAGDFNADGFVDSTDLNFIGLNWQSSIPTANTRAVPEPSNTVWFLLGGLLASSLGISRKK